MLRSPVAEVTLKSSVGLRVMEWIPDIPPTGAGHAVRAGVSVSPSSHASSGYKKPSPVVRGQSWRLQNDVGGLCCNFSPKNIICHDGLNFIIVILFQVGIVHVFLYDNLIFFFLCN